MKKKFQILIGILFLILSNTHTALASFDLQSAELYKPMSVIHLVVLLIALVCLVWALKILSLVKGGLMSKSWQMFGLGFGILIIAQLVSLGTTVKVMTLPEYIIPSLYLVMAVLWLFGLYQTRKVLG